MSFYNKVSTIGNKPLIYFLKLTNQQKHYLIWVDYGMPKDKICFFLNKIRIAFSFYFFQSIRLNKNILIFNQIELYFFVWKTNTVDLFSEQIFRAPFSGITTKEWTTNSYNTIQIFFGLVLLVVSFENFKKSQELPSYYLISICVSSLTLLFIGYYPLFFLCFFLAWICFVY